MQARPTQPPVPVEPGQTLGVPSPPQVAPPAQFPQSRLPPHPSPILPQYSPPALLQVSGTQPLAMQMPVLQDWVPPQPPQSMADPQPLPTLPQYCPPGCVQARVAQLESPTHRPALQVQPPGQAPQSSVWSPQPLPMVPQYCPPGCIQAIGVQTAASMSTDVPPVPVPPELEPPEPAE